jgi:pimeloyl-ACP methyl ester carboxylesterase
VSVWELEALSVSVDGRMLEVVLAGPQDGVPLFSHHGMPGAAEMLDPLVAIGAERNLRHITYSRPGYGRSDRLEGRSVASCAVDVAAVADALGYDRFYSVGSSGGGPHSIACAALLPERVIAAATIACPAPVDAAGLDWAAGMTKENLAEIAATRGSDDELEHYLQLQADSMSETTAEEIVTSLGDLVSDVDRQAVSGALGEFIVRELAHSLSTGVWGWFDDDRALFGRDWGFDLGEIRVPLSLWHGEQDKFVPIAHGRWLAEHVRADVHVLQDRGHMSLSLDYYGDLLDELLAR